MKLYTKRKTILADLQTPVGVYLKIRDLYPGSALLESSDYHSREDSYSFIGCMPLASFQADQGNVIEAYPDGTEQRYTLDQGASLDNSLYQFMQTFVCEGADDIQHQNGFFGYTSYDAIRHFESVKIENPITESHVPDLFYVLYRFIIVINPLKNMITIIENQLDKEVSQIDEIVHLLANRNFASYNFQSVGEEEAMISDATYREMVRKGIAHCQRGDVFQIVLSRQFAQAYKGDDFNVYRSLRSINPSPYLFYFDFGAFRIFGSSPETHLRIEKGRAVIDPIAGTFKRTGEDEKDALLAEQLRNDPKENAEHVMLVDLARNDLSRNASAVKLDIYKEIQFFSHVLHMVSRVSGELPKGINPIKVFADTFPAGTLSGAPKVRAMELIEELEQSRRGVYGGCIGFLGFDGSVNQAITIRTFLSQNNKLYYQAGAGVVAKSIVENELNEVTNKLGALKKAIDQANQLKN